MSLHILSMGISWTIGLSATEAYLRNAYAGSSYVFSLLIQEFEKAKTKHLMLGFFIPVESKASADIRVRVREGVIRIRSRKTAQRTVIRITAHVQEPVLLA